MHGVPLRVFDTTSRLVSKHGCKAHDVRAPEVYVWNGEKPWREVGIGAGVSAPTSAKTMLETAKKFVRGEWRLNDDRLVVLADTVDKPNVAQLLLPGPSVDLDDSDEVCSGLAHVLRKIRARCFAVVMNAWINKTEVRMSKHHNAKEGVCIMAADIDGGRAAGNFAVKRDAKGKERLGRWENWECDPDGTCLDDMVFDMLATAPQSEAVH
jgi:hypothetical protein